MNSQDTRNLFLAIALSVLVMAAWQYFYAGPLYQREHQAQTQAASTAPKPASTVSSTPGAAAPAAPSSGSTASIPGAPAAAATQGTVAQVLGGSPRVTIDTPSLGGSIDLRGGRIDDLILKTYHETIDPKSANIRLFSPPGAPDAYWATTGFVSPAGAKTPTLDTLWSADETTLTPTKPVTLTWDNGAGLVFKRVVSVDDKFMFTVGDSVTNKGDAAATVQSYGLVLRHGMPQVGGYSVLHEGFVGVIGDGGVQEVTYKAIDKDQGKPRTFTGDGGWLGFTDKYWGSAVIPEQTAPIEARFSATGTTQPIDYQADFLGKEHSVAPGATFETTTRVFAGAKEVNTIDNYQAALGIKKFDLMIDWGWFYFITKPLFRLIDAIYHVVGNFGVAILIVTVLVKLAFFPLANRSYRSMAKMKKIQPQIAALKDIYPDDKVKQQQEQMELFKKEGVNPGRRLPADGDPDPGVLRALQGHLHHDRDAACAVLRLDQGPFRARPDQCLHAVRADPLGADRAPGVRPLPRARHLAAHHGRVDVLPDEDEPGAGRSGSEADVLLDAGDLHLHARHVSRGPRHLLDLEQHADRAPAVLHHDESGREGRALGQSRQVFRARPGQGFSGEDAAPRRRRRERRRGCRRPTGRRPGASCSPANATSFSPPPVPTACRQSARRRSPSPGARTSANPRSSTR